MSERMIAEKRGPIGWMTIDNPARRNAVSLQMWEQAEQILADFAADPALRVVIVRGAGGKAFASGADISKFEQERSGAAAVQHYNRTVDRAVERLSGLPKPTLAMIRGSCVGGGLGLALACDLRICSESSHFALPAAKLGVGYGYAGVKRMVEVLGPAFAKELFYTGRSVAAAEALRVGLVSHVLPETGLESFALEMAETIAANAPLTIAAVKHMVQDVARDRAERDLARGDALAQACFESRDYVEGCRAFLEKRKPQFTGS
jgi:enoyl-CoA hydratase